MATLRKKKVSNDPPQHTPLIGRTGRAGKRGMATTLLTPADEPIFDDLRKYLQENDQKVPSELAVKANLF